MLARRPWWLLIVVMITLLFLASYGSAQLALSAPEQAKTEAGTPTPAPTEEAMTATEASETTVPDCADLTEATAAAAGSSNKVVRISFIQEFSFFNSYYID